MKNPIQIRSDAIPNRNREVPGAIEKSLSRPKPPCLPGNPIVTYDSCCDTTAHCHQRLMSRHSGLGCDMKSTIFYSDRNSFVETKPFCRAPSAMSHALTLSCALLSAQALYRACMHACHGCNTLPIMTPL